MQTTQDTTSIGTYLRELRRARHLTLRAVEAQVGVSNSYISQVESGRITQPAPASLRKLAGAYGVPMEHMMARAGYLPPDTSSLPGVFHLLSELTVEEMTELETFLRYLYFRRTLINYAPLDKPRESVLE